ncbi:MAG: MFS transporter [Saprospiraceae bacterium]|nr:MFS transporter [Bacteroidia bacterium]NNE16766.1 MFS transporter [Saprospiraceae bacterium]NNL92319.1 MFS transporter [Saprospiraceae bacterium]
MFDLLIHYYTRTIYYKSFAGLSKDIWLLATVMLINRSGAMVLPFLSIYLNQELNFDLSDCGIIMTCFGVGSVGGALFGGYLTDKIGYFKVMLTSLFFTALAFLVVMYLDSFYELCLGIFSISFIADTFRPANLTAIEAFSKKENLTRSIGLVRLAVNLGYAFGPFMGGYIATILGYDFLFIFNAFSVGSAGLFFFLFFKNKSKGLSIEKKQRKKTEKIPLPWNDIPYISYLFLFGITVIVFFQLIYIIPLFYKTGFGFKESLVGLLMAANGLLIFIIEMPLIYKIEKHFNPVTLVSFGGILIALGVLCFAVFNDPIVASIGFIVFATFGEMLSFPFSNTFALTFANDHNRGKYMGLYTMTFSMAHIIAPIGWFQFAENFGYNMTWIFGGVLCIVASIFIYMYKLRSA